MGASRKPSPTSCSVCKTRSGNICREIYTINSDVGRHQFDVTKAQAIVADGRQPVAVPTEALERFLSVNNSWDEQHLPHVAADQPGIVGQRFGALLLFDGTHRAERARREGRTFYAHMLTYAESMSCVMEQDAADVSPEITAREIRGVLRNNLHAGRISMELTLDPGDDPIEMEAAIRSHLTTAENRRVVLALRKRGAA